MRLPSATWERRGLLTLKPGKRWFEEDAHRKPPQTIWRSIYIPLSLFLAFVIGLSSGFSLQDPSLLGQRHSTRENSCTQPSLRREWRSLTEIEQQAYIGAVQCLTRIPSRVRQNGSLYDDFPWIHHKYGGDSHGSGSFLPWHRYFLHVFETALREECSYHGHLTYWDWSLDSEDLTKAPIWNNETGFGGDGDPDGRETIGFGRCVVDGPFKDLQLLFFQNQYNPHCLSRGFTNGNEDGELPTSGLGPDEVDRLLMQRNFTAFDHALQHGPHHVLANSIRGDFIQFYAPGDPVWYLHHTQLDRLWWLWQRRNPSQPSYKDSPGLEPDTIRMGGFFVDSKMESVMDTTGEPLCYMY